MGQRVLSGLRVGEVIGVQSLGLPPGPCRCRRGAGTGQDKWVSLSDGSLAEGAPRRCAQMLGRLVGTLCPLESASEAEGQVLLHLKLQEASVMLELERNPRRKARGIRVGPWSP